MDTKNKLPKVYSGTLLYLRQSFLRKWLTVKKVWEESKKNTILIVVGFPDPPRMIIFQQSKIAFDFFLFFCLKWGNRNLKCV